MKKGLFLVLLGMTFLLSFLAGSLYLYYSRFTKAPKEVSRLAPPAAEETDQIQIDKSDVPLNRPYRQIVLNNVWVKDYRRDFINIRGENLSLGELTLGYVLSGEEKNLIVPLIDTVAYSETRGNEASEGESINKGIISVDDITFEEGEFVTVVLAYIPNDYPVYVNLLPEYCKDNRLPVCNAYKKTEFGNEPIDINDYTASLVERNEKLDYKKVVIQSITRNLVIEPKQ